MRTYAPLLILLAACAAPPPNDTAAPPPGRYVGARVETLGAT